MSLNVAKINKNLIEISAAAMPPTYLFKAKSKICEEIISKLGANSIKDMGKVMGELKKRHADEIDFSKAGTILKELLNK